MSRNNVIMPGLKQGKTASLIEVYNEHRHTLKLFLIRRLRCPETAEDLTQETWFKINSGAADSATISNPQAYLFTLAANLANDYLKVEARRSELRQEYRDTLWTDADTQTPEQYVLNQDELNHMHKATADLRAISRQVFYLNRFEGYTYKEIAKNLDMSTTTVANHIRLVLTHLANARDDFSGE